MALEALSSKKLIAFIIVAVFVGSAALFLINYGGSNQYNTTTSTFTTYPFTQTTPYHQDTTTSYYQETTTPYYQETIATTTRPNIAGLKIMGAGATFQYPQIAHWASLFQKKTGAEISYQSVGTGAGQRMFLNDKVVDFAASDPPLSRTQWEQYQGKVIQIPWIMGAVAVVYNVPEIPANYNLKLTGEVIARIYRGEIEYWDDPSIKALNPEIANVLPRELIIAVHRSDSSGTTEVFTVFLNKAAPNIWTRDLVGKQVNWPVDATMRGIGGKGNEGVTAAVIQTRYSIGYVELSYAIEYKLPIAAIMNIAGEFLLPSDESIRKAAEGVSLPLSVFDDFSYTLIEVVYSSVPGSYPISTFVYIFMWSNYEDKDKALVLAEFLEWIRIEGYFNMIPGYVAPPEAVKELIQQAALILKSSH